MGTVPGTRERVGEFVRVATLVQVPEGEVRGFETAGLRLAVAHVPGGVFAFLDECPEDGAALSDGEVDEEGEVTCPDDGSAFDVESGEPVRGAAVDPLPVYRVRVHDGWIEVEL